MATLNHLDGDNADPLRPTSRSAAPRGGNDMSVAELLL